MPTELLNKLSPRRRFLLPAVAAVAGLVVLTATQAMGTAAATDATRSNHVEECASGTACLWINSAGDPDPAAAHDQRALVINPGNGSDLDLPTKYDLGKVHGVTAEFTDNISVVVNNLPVELCLLDTTEYGSGDKFGTKAPLRHVSHSVLVVPPWSSFAPMGGWNDTIDYYTTGQCPRNDIVFRTDTEEIVDRF